MARWPRPKPLSTQDREELTAFAEGYRLFELSVLPLERLSRQCGVAVWLATQDGADLWCRTVLQGWHWQTAQENRLCEGRKQGIAHLRWLTRELLADEAP
jgi:tRNA(Met) cytidine acetyltransferase